MSPREMAQEIHPTFVFNDWKWSVGADGEYGVPSAEQIEDKIWFMIGSLIERPQSEFIESGRLRVARDDEHIKISIISVLGWYDSATNSFF